MGLGRLSGCGFGQCHVTVAASPDRHTRRAGWPPSPGLGRIVVQNEQLHVFTHIPVTADDLGYLRAQAMFLAHAAGLDNARAEGFAVAVSEVATNSISHASGTGKITIVQDDAVILYAEISDHGPGMLTTAPTRPTPGAVTGRGLWISQQLTDRLRIHSGPNGTTVRLDMTVGGPGTDNAP